MKKATLSLALSFFLFCAVSFSSETINYEASYGEGRAVVSNKGPKAAFKTSVTSGDAPLVINFDATTSSGLELEYYWDFGDGSSAEGPLAKYLFMNPGTYNVILTVEDEDGKLATAVKKITVKSKIYPLTATQFQFSYDLTEESDYPVRMNFRLWQVNFDPGSVLTFKIGRNIFGYMPGEDFDSSDPLIILNAAGTYNGEAENADIFKLQMLPGGELRGHISTGWLEDNFDQRILPNGTSGVGTTDFTIYALGPDGRYKVYATAFNYAFTIKRKKIDGDVEETMIRGKLTDKDPTAEAEMTKLERQKAREAKRLEREKIKAEIKAARQKAKAEAEKKSSAAKGLVLEDLF
jgi:hypothetical protein